MEEHRKPEFNERHQKPKATYWMILFIWNFFKKVKLQRQIGSSLEFGREWELSTNSRREHLGAQSVLPQDRGKDFINDIY